MELLRGLKDMFARPATPPASRVPFLRGAPVQAPQMPAADPNAAVEDSPGMPAPEAEDLETRYRETMRRLNGDVRPPGMIGGARG